MRPSKAIEIVARATEVSAEAILGARRYREEVEARWLLIWLWRAEWGLGVSTISRRLKRDHAAILSGLRAHSNLADQSKFYRRKIDDVKAEYEREKNAK